METFWIVILADQHPMQATHRHASENEARAEAERLCKKSGGKTFIVLKAVARVRPASLPVVWDAFDGEDEPDTSE